MRIFLYEFTTGGGLLGDDVELLQSLEAEGRAMLSAVAHDLVALDGVLVATTRDARLTDFNLPGVLTIEVTSAEEEQRAFDRLAEDAHVTLLVAPELDGVLHERARRIEVGGGRLISPGSDFIAVAADKMATNCRLEAAGVPVPESAKLEVTHDGVAELPDDFTYPAVVKRIDGAGSVGTRLCAEPARVPLDPDKPWMIERYCAGIPVGVAVLCGPMGRYAMPAFQQRFADGSFSYVGGERLTDPRHAERAMALAARAVRSIGQTTGCVGVDLVLGDDRDGGKDFVIEVNPRLTTSYIGLQAIARGNLAAAMLDVATNNPPSMSFGEEPVEFAVEDNV